MSHASMRQGPPVGERRPVAPKNCAGENLCTETVTWSPKGLSSCHMGSGLQVATFLPSSTRDRRPPAAPATPRGAGAGRRVGKPCAWALRSPFNASPAQARLSHPEPVVPPPGGGGRSWHVPGAAVTPLCRPQGAGAAGEQAAMVGGAAAAPAGRLDATSQPPRLPRLQSSVVPWCPVPGARGEAH